MLYFRTLLELGASPNYRDCKGLTPLYASVSHKTNPAICEALLHDHATIGAKDLQGWQEVHQVRKYKNCMNDKFMDRKILTVSGELRICQKTRF